MSNKSYSAGNFSIRIEQNNLPKVKEELKAKKKKIFHAWGLRWAKVVEPLTPRDTGRLRQNNHFRSQENHLLIYNNLKYAAPVNNGHRGRRGAKFFEKSLLDHKSDYQKITEQILKE